MEGNNVIDPQDNKETVTIKEAAAILDIPIHIIYTDVRNNALPAEKVAPRPGGRRAWVVKREDLASYKAMLEERMRISGTMSLPVQQRLRKTKYVLDELIEIRDRLNIIIADLQAEKP